MPLRGYHTDRRPPSNLDHILAHPFEMALAVFGVLGGSASVLSAFSVVSVSQSVDRLPNILNAALGVFLVGGAVLILRGLFDDTEDQMAGWRLERTGLIITIGAWLSYSGVLAYAFPRSVLSWGLAVLLTLAHGFRFAATVREERRLRKVLR